MTETNQEDEKIAFEIYLNPETVEWLYALQKWHSEDGYGYDTLEEMMEYVMDCIATGARRPGSWERQMLGMMGLVS